MEPNKYHEGAHLLERLMSLNEARTAVRRAAADLDVEIEATERGLKAAFEDWRAERLREDEKAGLAPRDLARLKARAERVRKVEKVGKAEKAEKAVLAPREQVAPYQG